MIGSEQFTVVRPVSYLLSSAAGTSVVPTTQPPAGGCYLRLEGTGTAGTVAVTGTVGGSTTTETISTFDTDLVGFSTNLFTAITGITITSFTLMTVYPANESGDRINLPSSTTTFTILADSYDRFIGELSGQYTDFAGDKRKITKTLMYDGRYTLQTGDLITINGQQLTVVNISSQHGYYSAFLASMRGEP